MNLNRQYFSGFTEGQLVGGCCFGSCGSDSQSNVVANRQCPDSINVRVQNSCANVVALSALILSVLLIVQPALSDEVVASDPDFDMDGIPDYVDLDQDNDGIANSDEGYISFANLSDYPADSYVLLADEVVKTELKSHSQTAGSVYRYPLLSSRGVPSIEFVGSLTRTDTRVDWAVQQQLPKLKHLTAGQSEVRWQFMRFGTDDQVLVDIDLAVADLDGNRSETITVNTQDIAGYSVSTDTNLQIDDSVPGKLIFTARGDSDNTENDAVVLHLRSVSELNITYTSSPNSKVLQGLDNNAAGFRHNFTSGALDHYVAVPVVRHTDNDGYPDHRDLDSNNDGIPDAAADHDINRDGMVDGPVDSKGVPAIPEIESETIIDSSTDEPASSEQEPVEQVELLAVDGTTQPPVATNTSPASSTLNIISDLDRDSIADRVEGLGDEDGDGVPNQYDLDSDNDGLTDLIEAGAVDFDNNGVIDDAADSLVKTYTTIVPDFDNDGIPDFLDSDSDQDTLFDLVEAGGVDVDANGTIDGFIDQNGDGWDDRFLSSPLPLPDSDNDGNPDTLDVVDDSDTEKVVLEDFQQLPGEIVSNNDIVTGSGVAGCTLRNGPQAIDPTLWVLLLVLQFFYRRRTGSYCLRTPYASTH